MSEYQEYEDPLERERKRRKQQRLQVGLGEQAVAQEMLSKVDRDITDILAKQQKIRSRQYFANLAGMTDDVVKRGQYMVAANLVKTFHYEYYRHWSLFESKKGIFSRRERHEDEEERETVYMEADDE
jgi:hypothetical protein